MYGIYEYGLPIFKFYFLWLTWLFKYSSDYGK